MPWGVRPLLLLVLAVALVVAGCGSGGGDDNRKGKEPVDGPGTGRPAVVLGTKNFTEQYVLGQLYAQALRDKGFTVEVKQDIGATEVADRALTSGVIDLYPEYTGTSLSVVKGQAKVPSGPEATYRQAKRFYESRGQTLLRRTPFEDRDSIVVTRAFAERYGLESNADLAGIGVPFTLGGPPEFRTRFAGMVGLREVYGLRRVRFKPVSIEDIVFELNANTIQAADIFTTDPRLASPQYVVLEDPKGIFGYQNVAPVISKETLDAQGPAFAETLDAVSETLTNGVMRRLNAAVDVDGRTPEAVARRYLQQRDLI